MDEKALREYFNFDEDDLAANRDGKLSETQLARLDAERKHKPGIEWGIGALLFIIASAGVYAGVTALFQDENILIRIVFAFFFGVVWPYLFVKLGWQMIDSTRPKWNARVKVERGRLRFQKRSGKDIITYFQLTVGDRTVEVGEDISAMVAHGERYAMYYLAKTKGMLSLERIGKEKDA